MHLPLYMELLGLVRSLILMALVTAYGQTVSASSLGECKTPKGQRCVCAESNARKCATIAKAICLSGKTVETPAGRLLTAHENNVELFKQCRGMGGMKELVSNIPLIDNFHNVDTAKQNTAAAGD